jgi:hypothetical protein
VQGLHLVGVEGRGGLVEEEHLRLGDEGLGHLEELPVGQRQEPGRYVGEQLEIEVELVRAT